MGYFDACREAFARMAEPLLSQMTGGRPVSHAYRKVRENEKILTAVIHCPGKEVFICLEHAYWQFCSGMPLKDVCRNLAALCRVKDKRHERNWDLQDKKEAARRVFVKIVRADKEESRIKNTVHRHFLGLAAVCYVKAMVDGRPEELAVTRVMAEDWGMEGGSLYKEAVKNTKDRYGCFISRIPDSVSEKAGIKAAVDHEELPFDDEEPVYYATAVKKEGIEAFLLYEDTLKAFAGYVGCSFYLMPVRSLGILLVPESSSAGEKNLIKASRKYNEKSHNDSSLGTLFYYDRKKGRLENVCWKDAGTAKGHAGERTERRKA